MRIEEWYAVFGVYAQNVTQFIDEQHILRITLQEKLDVDIHFRLSIDEHGRIIATGTGTGTPVRPADANNAKRGESHSFEAELVVRPGSNEVRRSLAEHLPKR